MIESKIINCLLNSNKIAIVSHENPDGDCIGSMLALYLALTKKGKSPRMFLKNNVPKNLSFLPAANKIEIKDEIDEMFDVLVLLDTGELERTGIKNIKSCYKKLVNIDHHVTSEGIGDYYYINSSAAATGEIVYQLVKLMGIDNDKDIATCLYTSIFTDTGGFKYSNTTSVTHQIAGDLINMGINFVYIVNKVFDEMSLSKFNLLKDTLQTLELFEENKIAFLTITKEMFERNNASRDETENIINFAKNIEGVEVAALFIEEDSRIKVSLRSKYYLDVAAISKEFGGGGHPRAAGFSVSNLELNQIKNNLLLRLKSDVK
ncbi:bifunctional oligoribonuclease/PAP phosphatase NrnA [Caldicellulosiruptor changbaiensis]|uniref:Bifunctional oligoribonuclease/PAP phosphatase NrnA n=1 Tax=Caldicellulosiruptor changbaiensis TaxID=1222016 RepID=A0A3T0D555_9FIRM|nr:bifunctional oligoribonuclease/PAP phosphatase NrnA [Caldicellulosiruptor changbaiensis]AZT90190.1 bifunctional oligoribonuclease/PAP phosphatase NrnA [Caldicellulosiruptor changbaiensis]